MSSSTSPGAEQASLSKRARAWITALFSSLSNRTLGPRKERLFAGLTADRGVRTVVELGIGAAPNFQFYGSNVERVIGVDANPAAAHYAARAAAAAGLPPGRLQMVVGRGEQLPLADGSVDAVVGTHVLCCVDSPTQALAEVLRVLRPGGRFVFIEHVLAPPGTWLARVQRWVAPSLAWLLGCHVDRATLADIRGAGFSAVQAKEFRIGAPLVMRWWDPHVAGTAVKSGDAA